MKERLSVGTVQFGLPYGIANCTGQVDFEEAQLILTTAHHAGINALDTAAAYGASEEVLGRIGVAGWQIVTKLPPLPEACTDVSLWVRGQLLSSLKRLHVNRVYGLLLHRPLDLLSSRGSELYTALRRAKDDGLVDKIGASTYSPSDLDELASLTLDMVQAPFSILDRRLVTSGWLGRLYEAGVEVHARSVFLQGLLLMGRERRELTFGRWAHLWERWDSWLTQKDLQPLEACLRYALSEPRISRVVVGVDNERHLRQILAALQTTSELVPPADLVSDDIDLINPSRWGAR